MLYTKDRRACKYAKFTRFARGMRIKLSRRVRVGPEAGGPQREAARLSAGSGARPFCVDSAVCARVL